MLSTRIFTKRAGPFLVRRITRQLQTDTATKPPTLGVASTVSITAAIKNDHRDIEAAYNEVVSSKDSDHQQRYGNLFTWELAKHSVGEELVLYPAFEKHLGSAGKQIADTDRKDHHEIKELLKEFQNMTARDANYVPKLTSLWCKLEDHIKDEEAHDLPALEEKLSPDASQSMARSFGRTKHFVPSRSHPSAGEHPPFETVMGLLAAPIDMLADMFRKFPDQPASGQEEARVEGPITTVRD
jgi:hemerythrin superfamily protein